ncbi:MAG: hypothetical protein QOF62_2970 [Pyrinomonadaceae bacterium]|jgi:hypothetical protein|nr:hypothetical protein [Pyrinomonadaceae bacterium]
MDRIVASVRIDNALDASKRLSCDAFVDINARFMVLPASWKDRLGELESTRTVELETATQGTVKGEVCGPVRIEIEGFRPICSEVTFVEMKTENGRCEPLIGSIVLAQSQAGLDMLGHWLVPIHMDLK